MQHASKIIWAGILVGVAVFSMAPSCLPEARNLGTPVKSMSIRSELLVRDPVTERPTYYSGMFTSEGTARLIRFDYFLNTVNYFPLPGAKGVYGLAEGLDGSIYCGSILPARLFRFDPLTETVTDLGDVAGEEYVLDLRTGPDGKIYAATYPNAKVVVFDPENGSLQDLGSMHETQQYCSEAAVSESGLIFCGISPRADLVNYNPADGTRQSILPDGFENASTVGVHTEGDTLFASIDGVLFIMDVHTFEILMEIQPPQDGWIGTHVPVSGGPVIIHGLDQGNVRYNAATGELDPWFPSRYRTYDNEAGIAFRRAGGRQLFQALDLRSDEVISEVDISGDGDGMGVFSLGLGPDGCIYGGSVSLLHLFRYDPSTDLLEDLGFPYPAGNGEFYSIHTQGDHLYTAAYSGAELAVYDPFNPWDPASETDPNPRKIGPVGGEQNRPHAMTSLPDGTVYVGSEPDYGLYGGALTIFDPVSQSFDVHRDIIPDQTILSLTAGLDGRTVYGGSSIRGGTGTEPKSDRARFFAWDADAGEKTVDLVPVIGAQHIDALVTAPDGSIYGSVQTKNLGSRLFVFNPERGRIVHRQSISAGRVTEMVPGHDGYIYARTDDTILRMKPRQGLQRRVRFQILYRPDQEGKGLALDSAGNVYFGVGTDLYVLDRSLLESAS